VVLEVVKSALGTTANNGVIPQAVAVEHLEMITTRLSRTAEDLAWANSKLEVLIDATQRMTAELDPQKLVDQYSLVARQIVGAGLCAIGILETDGETWSHVAVSGASDDVMRKPWRAGGRMTKSPIWISARRSASASLSNLRRDSMGGCAWQANWAVDRSRKTMGGWSERCRRSLPSATKTASYWLTSVDTGRNWKSACVCEPTNWNRQNRIWNCSRRGFARLANAATSSYGLQFHPGGALRKAVGARRQ